MIDMKIGLGIVTHNRPELLEKALRSVVCRKDLHILVVNDGDGVEIDDLQSFIHDNETNLGVGKSKNRALKHLYNLGCDYIFLMEDDIYVKDENVFEKYIEASKKTGIQHFNFSQHGVMNKNWPGGTPNPVLVLSYKDLQVPLYRHCVGAFSMYTRKCLQECGFICEEYYNACEHVDHTFQIVKAGMHPPFWYFADIENSWEYLGDEEWSIEKSTISSKPNHQEMMREADQIFVKRNGCLPLQIPLTPEEGVIEKVKEIKKNYASR